ncbi:hypothetical protein LSAT2_012410 [Lamellibrachia satsuma]|nr:hypothetical protein LSAT2_027882 [Lamellibrachia satsuma]KAI0237120.1 hypothetical protein LSAT2_012410 [Lamellibrachia satsuma]
MTTIRSSVRPKSSKQPWGTIIHPQFGLGYQKLTSYELDQTIDRLSRPAQRRETVNHRVQQADLDRYGIKAMVERLCSAEKIGVPDSRRTQKDSIYRDMGALNSYAWKGYN